jgi:hypothetical protein
MVFLRISVALSVFCSVVSAQELIRVHQDFSRDPGWEGFQNRIVAQNPPRH